MMYRQDTSSGMRTVTRLTALAVLWAQLAPVWAAPSQIPLITRPDTRPRPNVMLTVDDSGSMTYQYLPEREFELNGYTVAFPNDGRLYVHPNEIRQNVFAPQRWGNMVFDNDSRIIPAVPPSLVSTQLPTEAERRAQYQMRSPDVNRLYYDPAQNYTTWQGVTEAGTPYRFLQPALSRVALDPLALDDPQQRGNTAGLPSRTVVSDAAVDLTDTAQSYTARWYCGAYCTPSESTKAYNPALLYLLRPGTNPNNPANYDHFDLNASNVSEITYPRVFLNREKDGCTVDRSAGTTTCSRATELANFARWFAFHRSRLFVAQGAMPEAFNGIGDTMRVGWATLHTNGGPFNIDGVPSNIVQQGVRNWDAAHKRRLAAWIRSRNTYSGTPTKDAVFAVGRYFERTDNRSPWASDMDRGTPLRDQLACRRAYNIVMTDGYYRDSTEQLPRTYRNADNTRTTDGTAAARPQYTPTAPFRDNASDTLADFAMYFWSRDLQPDLPNQVPPVTVAVDDRSRTQQERATLSAIKSNPATWQHLTQFMVGFGVTGQQLGRTELDDPQAYDNKLLQLARCGSADGECWPDTPDEIDDLWHAALNTRGRYFAVDNAAELKQAIADSLDQSQGDAFREAGVATASTALQAGNVRFVPEYTPIAWSGDVRAFRLDEQGRADAQPLWAASTMRPAAPARNLVVWNSANRQASAFQHNNLSVAQRERLGAQAEAVVAFVRGESPASESVREAKAPLPDFINATPLYVGNDVAYNYNHLNHAPRFADYLALKQARGDAGLLFVGGNGGMLHVFDANSGVEVLGFLPEAGLSKLSQIADPAYTTRADLHQYVVDGLLTEGDVFVQFGVMQDTADSERTWHNLVVGTMGAGGRAVFALTVPTENPTALDPSVVRWEVQSDDIGYVTSEPQIGVLPNGRWMVFLGNGVDAPSGRTGLAMIDVATGEVSFVPVADPLAGGSAGMGGVRLLRNANGEVIGAYAGDMSGRIWRFEYQGDTLQVGYSGAPLFVARDAEGGTPQPITAAPLVTGSRVATGPSVGQLIVFNTGRVLYDSDTQNSQRQSAYGIRDAIPIAQSTEGLAATPADRQTLVQQVISSAAQTVLQLNAQNENSTEHSTFFEVTGNDVDWRNTSTQGWVLDLNFPGSQAPKAIYDPVAFGPLVLISAVDTGSTEESCAVANGQGYYLLLNAATGGRWITNVLDANGNGVIDASDGNFSGGQIGPGATKILTRDRPGDGGTSGGTQDCLDGSLQYASGSRLSQVCSDTTPTLRPIRDRVWRQLLNPPQPAP